MDDSSSFPGVIQKRSHPLNRKLEEKTRGENPRSFLFKAFGWLSLCRMIFVCVCQIPLSIPLSKKINIWYVYIYIHFFWTKVFAYIRVICMDHATECVISRIFYRWCIAKKKYIYKQFEERGKKICRWCITWSCMWMRHVTFFLEMIYHSSESRANSMSHNFRKITNSISAMGAWCSNV